MYHCVLCTCILLTCIYVSSRYLCVISVTYRKCFASNYCASISVNVYVYMLVHWRMARFLSLYCSASRYCLCSIPVTKYILCMSCIEFSIQLCHCLCSALKRSSKSIPVTYLSALRCCFFFFSCSVTLTLVTVGSIIMMECIDVHSVFSFRDRACTIGLVGG